jgi:acetylornithine deacetylase/succinyl-diaminopimelate desuccinylase-like protein
MKFIKQHHLKPRFTIRFVAFADEEIGFSGALRYGEMVKKEIEQ